MAVLQLGLRVVSSGSLAPHPFNRLRKSGQKKCDITVKDKRPVNLDIGTIALPITAIASILHRASGAFIFFAVAILLALLGQSLSGPEGFAAAQECLNSFIGKLLVWGTLAGIIYHSVAGVKHLVMDAGIGETMEGGIRGAQLVFVVSAVLIVIAGLWIW